jgi:hypothetical protein
MNNHLETMLSALKSAQSLLTGLDYAAGPVDRQLTAAIAVGEAELRRGPDAVYLGSESEYGGDLIRLDMDISVGTELFIRGEIK